MEIQLVIGFLDLVQGLDAKQKIGVRGNAACGFSVTFFHDNIVTISFSIYLSSIMFCILFLCFISISMTMSS